MKTRLIELRRLVSVLILIVFTFSGCGQDVIKSGVRMNVDSLNTAFILKFNDKSYKGNISYKNNRFEFDFTHPQEISGIKFFVYENTFGAGFDDITTEFVFSEKKQIVAICNALESLLAVEKFEYVNNRFEYKNALFKALIDQYGNLLLIKTKDAELIMVR